MVVSIPDVPQQTSITFIFKILLRNPDKLSIFLEQTDGERKIWERLPVNVLDESQGLNV